MPDAPTFLRITDVSKRYGDRVVLRDVDLEVAQGQTVALIGPSGGGKSSLLRCINGLQPFDGGEIRRTFRTPSAKARGTAAFARDSWQDGGVGLQHPYLANQTRLAAKELPPYACRG